MHPLVFSPLVKWTFVALGGVMAVHWVVKEVRRVNDELEAQRLRAKIRDQGRMPKLRLDPKSGEYRP